MKLRKGKNTIPVSISNGTQIIPMKQRGVATVEIYHGTYEVTPNAHAEIELNTQGKKMERNVVVESIPYYETHNQYGMTVYIGE